MRPNIHITDMVESYIAVLEAPEEIISGNIYNVGYENQSVSELATIVQSVVGNDVKLTTSPTDDNRSYHISSKKIMHQLGFSAKHTIREAVVNLCEAFEKGKLPNSLEDENYFNLKRMQSVNLS